jgi:hypothetical protein
MNNPIVAGAARSTVASMPSSRGATRCDVCRRPTSWSRFCGSCRRWDAFLPPRRLADGGDAMTPRAIIQQAAERGRVGLGDLTVMSTATDPYRLDTPANHRIARWLVDAWGASGARRPIHPRGLHYALVSMNPAPLMLSGEPYINSHDCWEWLATATRAARWLGYIPFDALEDERNAEPVIYTQEELPAPFVGVVTREAPCELPTIESVMPSVFAGNFAVRQPYRIVLVGEKQSLRDVLLPIVRRVYGEMVLPTGELSNALLEGIVRRAADDGRPCRVFYLSDFDPTGWTMPIGVARKVQALVDRDFAGLDVQVHRCALTFDQVKALGLPATPLKETERRSDRWRERWGVEQTEIDALATLRPSVLRQIVEEAVAPYWDADLDRRVGDARAQAYAPANRVLQERIDAAKPMLTDVEALLGEGADLIRQAFKVSRPIVETIRREVEEALPGFKVPEPQTAGDVAEPIFDSLDAFDVATRKLIEERI